MFVIVLECPITFDMQFVAVFKDKKFEGTE